MLWGSPSSEYMQELFVAEVEMLLPHKGLGSLGEGMGGRPEMDVMMKGPPAESAVVWHQLQAEVRQLL